MSIIALWAIKTIIIPLGLALFASMYATVTGASAAAQRQQEAQSQTEEAEAAFAKVDMTLSVHDHIFNAKQESTRQLRPHEYVISALAADKTRWFVVSRPNSARSTNRTAGQFELKEISAAEAAQLK
jgi:hypothetical protein